MAAFFFQLFAIADAHIAIDPPTASITAVQCARSVLYSVPWTTLPRLRKNISYPHVLPKPRCGSKGRDRVGEKGLGLALTFHRTEGFMASDWSSQFFTVPLITSAQDEHSGADRPGNHITNRTLQCDWSLGCDLRHPKRLK